LCIVVTPTARYYYWYSISTPPLKGVFCSFFNCTICFLPTFSLYTGYFFSFDNFLSSFLSRWCRQFCVIRLCYLRCLIQRLFIYCPTAWFLTLVVSCYLQQPLGFQC
jgi:hypothetical protein